MARFVVAAVLSLICAAAASGSARACTAFGHEDDGRMWMGKSYDWDVETGAVHVNERGAQKVAHVTSAADQPLRWTSRFGSVTLNQYGREHPNGGLNEAGLAVEVLWLHSTEYPERDARPVVNELQFVQWALDQFDSVDALVRGAAGVRISRVYGRLHYFACDATGDCAVIEFLNHRLVVHHRGDLPVPALTNHDYGTAVEELAGSTRGSGSWARFRRTAKRLVEKAPSTFSEVFAVLDDVRAGARTKWQIAYDLTGREIHVRTRTHRTTRRLALSELAFECGHAAMLDLAAPVRGDARAALRAYDSGENFTLTKVALDELGGAAFRLLAPSLARTADATVCSLPARSAPAPSSFGGRHSR